MSAGMYRRPVSEIATAWRTGARWLPCEGRANASESPSRQITTLRPAGRFPGLIRHRLPALPRSVSKSRAVQGRYMHKLKWGISSAAAWA